MASLQAIRTKGHTYWRIVESRRVNGKPRPVPVLYIGTADALLERLLSGGSGVLRVQSFEHGSIAALKAAADRLQIADLIDQHVPGSAKGLTIGETFVLAALNRACHPCSKRAWSHWAAETSLGQFYPGVDLDALTSQFFWDRMDAVPDETLAAIEADLVQATVNELGINLDTLFFDTTNFYTFIDSTNDRAELPRRGHNKQHRNDLRQVGLGLLVSREGQLPLLSQVYPGNENDATCFPKALALIRERLKQLGLPMERLTLVFDRGNNSRENFKAVDKGPHGYVAALSPASVPDLRDLPASAYHTLPDGPLAGIPVYRERRVVWGTERTVLMFLSEELRQAQLRGLEQQLTKRLRELEDWRQKLGKPRSGPKDAAKAVAKFQEGQYLKAFLTVTYDPAKEGSERLSWSLDTEERGRIEEHFGKRVLITSRHDWTDEAILSAYRGQSQAEASFRQLKDDDHLAVRPQYHWTDQKIRVHAFICLVALLMARTVEYHARAAGFTGSLSGLLDQLARLRLAMVIQPTKGRPRCTWQLEETDPASLALFSSLVPAKAPFCYTNSNN
jgi:transposase